MQGAESGVATPAAQRVNEAREALDRWVREVVAWHFDPATGCSFWLERASMLGFDPRERIQTFADLKHFGGFEDEWLRGGPVQRWVPKGCAGKPVDQVPDRRHDRCPEDAHQLRGLPDRLQDLQHPLPRRSLPDGCERLMLDLPVRAVCGSPLNTCASTVAASVSASTSIPDGHQSDQEGRADHGNATRSTSSTRP